MDLGDGDEVDVGLGLEVEDVPLADQAVADEADADAVVGAEDPPIARGREGRARARLDERTPAQVRSPRGFDRSHAVHPWHLG